MDRKPLRVAIFSNYLPPVYSGAGQQALRIGTWLKQVGHSVFFVTPRHPDHDLSSEIKGIRVHYVKARKITGNRGNILVGIKALCVLVRKRNEFDILFCPGMGTLIGFLFLVLKVLKKKIILRMSLYVDDPAILKKRKIGPYLLLPYHLADKIVAPSTARLKSVTDVYPEKEKQLIRINNCVDTDRFIPQSTDKERIELADKLQLDPEKRYVTYVGRIIARKGVEFLIEMWREVAKQDDNAVLLLVGPIDYKSKYEGNAVDPLYKKLQKKITESDLEDSVIFTGETDRVHDYLKISDVFVFASTAEGLPSAPIEAMSAGVPPVVLNIEDIMSDIIDQGQNGIIVSDKDIKQFSKSIIRFLKDEKCRIDIGNRARKKIVEHFSIEAVGKKYTKLFYEVMENEY